MTTCAPLCPPLLARRKHSVYDVGCLKRRAVSLNYHLGGGGGVLSPHSLVPRGLKESARTKSVVLLPKRRTLSFAIVLCAGVDYLVIVESAGCYYFYFCARAACRCYCLLLPRSLFFCGKNRSWVQSQKDKGCASCAIHPETQSVCPDCCHLVFF